MSQSNSPVPSRWEDGLLQLLRDPRVSREQVLKARQDIPAGERFVMKNAWMEMARNTAFENWRRLASYQMLIERGVAYPCELASFVADALLPLGIQEEQLTDMSMASYVPVHRERGTVYVAVLPFSSSLGSTGLYIVVDEKSKVVQEAAVYPGIAEATS